MNRPVNRARRPWALGRGLAPLRQSDFGFLLAGQSVSYIGDNFYVVALPWYVLASHGGVVLLGTVLAAYGIPRTALIAVGGHASDRWRPWTVMLAMDCVRAGAVAALAIVAAFGPARALLLLPIGAVFGAADGLSLPASFAIAPALLAVEDLQAGNALLSGGGQLANLAGPAVGGAAVAFLGSSRAFGLDAVSFVLSALALVGVRRAMHARQDKRSRPAEFPGSGDGPVPRRETVAPAHAGTGVPTLRSLFRSERILQVMLLVTVAGNLGLGGLGEVGMPSLARGPLHAGARGYGILLAAFAAGALLGTLAAGQARQFRRPFVAGGLAFLAGAPLLAAIPFLPDTAAVAVALAAFGSLNGFANVTTMTAFQKWADPKVLGRLMGVTMLGSFGIYPVSVALAAFLVRYLGLTSLFLFTAALCVFAVFAGLSQRPYREFGARQPADDITSVQTAPHQA